jgi:hypothetical protein
MMHQPKLMVIGLDSVSLTLLERFRDSCPNIQAFLRRGASGRALPCFPVYTPTNWAALSTGADSSTTGAEGWYNETAGTRLSTFDRRAILCDTIFDAAARARLRTLAISYPTGYPVAGRLNYVLAPLDRGLVSNCLARGRVLDVSFDSRGRFSFTLVEEQPVGSGAARAKAVGATEDGANSAGRQRRTTAGPRQAWLFQVRKDRYKFGRSADPDRAELNLRSERWSPPIRVRLDVPGRPGRCNVRVMVFDGGRRVAISEAYDVGMLGAPAAFARAIYDRLGPPTEHSVFFGQFWQMFRAGRPDPVITRLMHQDMAAQADWIARAAVLAQQLAPFDVFYLHHHYPDSVLHHGLAAAEGSTAFTPAQRALARKAIAECLRICDRLVARLLKLAGPRTTVLLVSDHGTAANRYGVNLNARLIECGLAVRAANGKVDASKSCVCKSRRVDTWLTVKARPQSRRYQQLQDRVIDALLDWKALALRRKDAHLLGYHGQDCGDVVFHYNSGFAWSACPPDRTTIPDRTDSNHGPQMPVTFSKLSDNLAFFGLRGPGIRRSLRWDAGTRGHVRLVDLLPTACSASGVPIPRNCTGAVRWELLGEAPGNLSGRGARSFA